MKRLLLRTIFTISTLCVVLSVVAADEVELKANVPLLVTVGEPFPVEYALNAKPEDDSFTPPKLEGFDVVAGPRISSGTSIQIVNGNMTRTVNYTYTYVLMAQEAGRYTIPAASVKVKGVSYSSTSTPVEVVKESESINSGSQQSGASQQADNQQRSQNTASGRVGKDDLFLLMNLSQKSVFKGEPIRAEIKLYTRVDIVNNDNLKLPTFNGFWAQDVTDSRQQGGRRETYNGKVYDTHIVREYLLYPQQSGDLVIDPAQIDIVAQVVVQSRNMDPFFGGGHEFYNVRRHLETPSVTIDVKRLPASASASFSGAVGTYAIEVIPPESASIVANAASTIKLRVSGSGNISFVQAPKIDLPNSFELYNVKTTESLRNEATQQSGYKEFEYPFIARAEGDYTIPAVEFSYFDPSNRAYTTVKTNPFSLTITADKSSAGGAAQMVSGVTKSDIELLGRDIRFIKLGEARFLRDREPFILSTLYLAIVAVIVAVWGVLLVLLRRMISDSKNEALRRGKRASKVAVQRFKSAKSSMDEGDERTFYREMLQGLWGYMSDKLNIPVADLTKECVREELMKRGGSKETAQEFSAIITRCDEAQYSPVASTQMDEVYGEGLRLVSKIEELFKRK
ncbi:MAG: BatD family protein [Rikenellaceae bacterium]